MAKKMSGEILMTRAWETYQTTRELLSEIEIEPIDPKERIKWLIVNFYPVYKALSFAIEKFSQEINLSWHRDSRKRGLENETAEVVVSWGENIHIPIPLQFLQSKGLLEKVKLIMSKVIEVANGVNFVLDLDPETEVSIEITPFLPKEYSNTKHSFDTGNSNSKIAEGVYFSYRWDHTRYPYTEREESFNEETGEWEEEEWQEWATKDENEYTLIITDPHLVGVDESAFVDSNRPPADARLRAEFRLARIIRRNCGKVMSTRWNIHIVDELPQIVHEGKSTPANTSNVSWGGYQVNKSIVVKTVDGWTGSKGHADRDVYIMRPFWTQLEG